MVAESAAPAGQTVGTGTGVHWVIGAGHVVGLSSGQTVAMSGQIVITLVPSGHTVFSGEQRVGAWLHLVSIAGHTVMFVLQKVHAEALSAQKVI